MSIIVPISSSWDPKGLDKAVKDINKAGQQLGGLSSASKQSSQGLDSFGLSVKKLGGLVAGAFAVTQVTQFFKASIKGAIEDEASLRKLNKTLENMGFAGSANQVDKFIGKLQYSAAIADDELRPALNNLVLATGNLSQSQKLLQVALDVSAGSGRDLDQITVALAKAFNGNFTALKKLNLGIDESLIKNKDLNGILSVLTTKFAGASANAVDTYAGKMKVLSLAVGDAQELIGYSLLNALDNSTGSVQDLAQSIQDLGQGVADTITGFTYYVNQVKDLASALGLADTKTKSLMDETSDLFDGIVQMIPILGTYIKLWKDKGRAERIANAPAQTSPAGTRLARQAKEAQDAIKEQTDQTDALKKAQEELKKNTESLTETNANYAKFVAGTSPQSIQGATMLAQTSLVSIQKLMSNHPKINDGLVKSFKDLASVVQTNFSYALDQAKTKLNEAKQQYDSFKTSIKTSITGVMSFSAIEEGTTFLDSLTKQSKQAQDFGGKIQQLLALGLNQRAITQVAEAGYEVGTTIADEIIAGGVTVVQQVNTLVASVESIGETVSTSLADQFYSAGVNAAQSLVDALISELNASAAIIAQAIANATQGGTTVVDTKPKPKELKPKVVTQKAPAAALVGVQNKLRTMLPGRAVGGPVTSGMPYIVGERGPELFMPNTSGSIISNNRLSSSGGSNINITVNAGIGANGAQIGREIVDAIKKYERTSGPVFASA
jgi:hypothetical protein